jgi:tetratricopeptide (TPR) repeat protein
MQLNQNESEDEITYEQICQVEAWCKTALANPGTEAQIHAAVAAACEQHGHWKAAIARYRDAVALAPDDLRYRLGLSQVLGCSGKPGQAVRIWEDLIIGHYERMMNDKAFKDQNLVLILDHLCNLIEDGRVALRRFSRTKDKYTTLLFEDWNSHLKLAQALVYNDEPQEAANMLNDLLNQHQDRLEYDETYRTAHWGSVVPLRVRALWESKDYVQLELACQQLVDEGRRRGDFEDFAKYGIYVTIMVLSDQDRHAEVIGLMESLDNETNLQTKSRLTALLLEYAEEDRFHERVFLAARRSGKLRFVEAAYRSAIRTAREDNSKVGASPLLQSHFAAFEYSRGTPAERTAAIATWSQIVYAPTNPDDSRWGLVAQARHDSADKLAASLFYLARREEGTYMAELQQLARHERLDVMNGSKSPQILLGRLYQLQGKADLARHALRDVVKDAFLMIEADDVEGWYRLSMALQSVDDEANALAAWRTYTPRKPSKSEGSVIPHDFEFSQDQPKCTEFVANGERPQSSASDVEAGASSDDHRVESVESPDSANTTGAVTETRDSANDIANTSNAVSDSSDEAADDSKDNPHPEKLEGDLLISCDGHCGSTWSYTGEVDGAYCCKDCHDIQFCPDCFAKLKAGSLMRSICDPAHSHLKLPSFDKKRWEITPDDQMWVDDELVSKSDWLQRIKVEWKLDEESLRARERSLNAAMIIQRVWRVWYRLKKKRAAGALETQDLTSLS